MEPWQAQSVGLGFQRMNGRNAHRGGEKAGGTALLWPVTLPFLPFALELTHWAFPLFLNPKLLSS